MKHKDDDGLGPSLLENTVAWPAEPMLVRLFSAVLYLQVHGYLSEKEKARVVGRITRAAMRQGLSDRDLYRAVAKVLVAPREPERRRGHD